MLLRVPFEPWHLECLNVRPEQQATVDFGEGMFGSLENYGNAFLMNAAYDDGDPCAWTGLHQGKPIICAGVFHIAPHIGEAWSVISSDLTQLNKSVIIRFVKEVKAGLDRLEYKRIQANTEESFIEARRFLEFLGFKEEGIMRAYSPDGQDSVMYGRVQ